MRNVSAAFQSSIIADVRRTAPKVIIHIVDPDIVYGSVTYTNAINYSSPDEVIDEVNDILPVSTFEINRWVLDGSQVCVSSTPEAGTAFCSNTKSSNNGRSLSSYVQIAFTGVTILQTCTIVFSDAIFDAIPEDFTVEILQSGGVVAYTATITGNTLREVKVDGFTVNSPEGIRVTCSKLSIICRRLRVAEIIAGVHETWTGDELAGLELKQQVDLTLETIPFSTCSMLIDNSTKRFDPRNKEGLFDSLEDRQGVDVFIGTGNPMEYVKMGHFYMGRSGWRTSDNSLSLQWDLYDIIGLLYDRAFTVPSPFPTTLEGWIQEILGQFSSIFANAYEIEAGYESTACVADDPETIEGRTCGDMIRFLCEYVGLYPVATIDGYLALVSFDNLGNEYTLDNLTNYPQISENKDVDRFDITLQDGTFGATHITIGGNTTTSGYTRAIDNPFVTTSGEAQAIVNRVLNYYGGNVITLTGRGNPSSELGDVDSVWLDASNAASGRRYRQSFRFQNGVLQACESQLIQGDGALSYSKYAILTTDQTWSFPSGVTDARILLVGGGYSGATGANGTWNADGAKGADGSGGKIYTDDISFGDGSTFSVVIGAAEGGDSTFGAYTSASGTVYPYGYGDLLSGRVFGRTGVESPLANSGDGGKGGKGGSKGEREWKKVRKNVWDWVVYKSPGSGRAGASGATGAVVVYWNE